MGRLRAAGFTFQRQADRVEIWRQVGGGQRVNLPRRDQLTEDHAKVILVQAGLSPQQVLEFFKSAATT